MHKFATAGIQDWLIYFIVGISILCNKMYYNKLSDHIYGGLVAVFTNFRALLCVNNSL